MKGTQSMDGQVAFKGATGVGSKLGTLKKKKKRKRRKTNQCRCHKCQTTALDPAPSRILMSLTELMMTIVVVSCKRTQRVGVVGCRGGEMVSGTWS